MKPSHTLCPLLMLGAMLSAPACHAEEPDSLLMRHEADAFLARLPAGLQDRQTEAVHAATGGDTTPLRAIRASRNAAAPVSPGVRVAHLAIPRPGGGDIPLRLYSPAGAGQDRPLPLLVYLHGGGWTFGSLNSCARFCDALAATGRAAVLAVDYALAPEHPYPEGLTDCLEAIAYATAHAAELGSAPGLVSAGGDSSGGNLALAAALARNAAGEPALRSLVLFYPVTLAAADGSAAWADYGRGFGLDAGLMEAFNEAYTTRLPAGAATTDALVSPALATDEALRQLPPVLMVSAERDILAAQGAGFATRLAAAGGNVSRTVLPGTVHLFITVAGQEQAFRRSVELTAGFLGR